MATRFDQAHTDELLAFTQSSPTPFHAVAQAAARLEKAGFARLEETESWADGAAVGARYVLRDGALIAWILPEDAGPERPLRILGSHTDSPTLRVKPVPDTGTLGWRQVAVEAYGGPLLNSWLDRDLGLAGRLVLRDGTQRLVNVERPLLRVPQLAVHLDRSVNQEGVKLNPQQHLQPVWGLGEAREGDLIAFVAGEHGLPAEDVFGWDLIAYDVQPPAYLGRDREFVVSGRMDNLVSVHASVAAMAAAATEGVAAGPIPMMAAMDHEETGSASFSGAAGAFLEVVLERLIEVRGGHVEARARAYAGSFVASADMAHAVHPNYSERHDRNHQPLPNGGPVLKVNSNQRYATDGRSRTVWARACERAGVPWQVFVNRNDIPGGTTIGPITATRLGILTFDVGVPGLSMHSAREMVGSEDPWMLAAALRAFLEG